MCVFVCLRLRRFFRRGGTDLPLIAAPTVAIWPHGALIHSLTHFTSLIDDSIDSVMCGSSNSSVLKLVFSCQLVKQQNSFELRP